MGRGGGREEGEEEEEEEARGRREGEGNGWEDATQVFPECSHPRLPNAKRPCTSQTELGNLHVGDKKSWAGKSSFFLVSFLPSPTPDPPSYILSATPATAVLRSPGVHLLCSACTP